MFTSSPHFSPKNLGDLAFKRLRKSHPLRRFLQGDEMLHVDVDVPYVESFLGLTSSLLLGPVGSSLRRSWNLKHLFIVYKWLFQLDDVYKPLFQLMMNQSLHPGTPNNHLQMDVWWNNHSHVKVWNHPIETTIYKQMFQVPGSKVVVSPNIH